MNLGVLLLSCNDAVRQTSFTRNWAERAIQNVADYYFAQSGGRESITFKVFDWYQLPMSVKQWVDLGMGVGAAVRPTVAQGLAVDLDPYTHILIGIDVPGASGGTTPGAYTLLAATNFTPQLISHELGHRYGAQDAWGDTADSPTRYHNRWCVMTGAEGWPATYACNSALTDLAAQGLDQSGPGMSAPELFWATGWLQPNEHGVSLDLTGTDVFSSGGRVEELSALAGAPGPGWTRPPVVIRYYDFLVEYRIGTAGGWDRGLPSPGEGAGGWVVVHRNPPNEFPSAVNVGAMAAQPGATLVLGEDNPIDIHHDGPLRLSVLSYNAATGTIRLAFSRRAARPLPSSTPYGGVSQDGGGLIWTPGGGFTPVPPHSPMLHVLSVVSKVHALQELMLVASGEEATGISEQASVALRELADGVAQLRPEPSLSPLAQALENISKVQRAGELLRQSHNDDFPAREFLDESSQRLAEVQRELADTLEQERRQ